MDEYKNSLGDWWPFDQEIGKAMFNKADMVILLSRETNIALQEALLELVTPNLPPIQYFFGNTPLRNWINKLPSLDIPFFNTKRFGGQAMAYFYHNFFMIDGKKPNPRNTDEAFFDAFLNLNGVLDVSIPPMPQPEDIIHYAAAYDPASPDGKGKATIFKNSMVMGVGKVGKTAIAAHLAFLTAQYKLLLIYPEINEAELQEKIKATGAGRRYGTTETTFLQKIEDYIDNKKIKTLHDVVGPLKLHPKPWESNTQNKGGKKNKKNRKW